MRKPIFALVLTALLSIGCDDSGNSGGTVGGETSTSPSSGSTVAAPPPVTTTTQPTTQPIRRDANDVTEQHRQNHNIPATPEAGR